MARAKGLLGIPQNFEPEIASAFDARANVPTKADLTIASNWTANDGGSYLYNGMTVTVAEDTTSSNNGIYILLDADNITDINSWQQVGEGAGFPFTGSAQITGSLGITGSISVTDNVGIGTNTPTQTLHVSSSTTDAVAKFQSSDTKAFIIIEDDGDQGFVGVQTDKLVLGTNTNFTSTDNVYIKNDGNVGIGNSSPSSKLTVSGDISSTGNITTSTGYISSATNITASGGNISLGESTAANIVGAGDITITPGRNLYLQHSENYSVQIQTSEGVNIIDAVQGQVTITGNITASANISANGYVSASEGSFGSGATTINTSINTIGNITSSANISASGDITGDTGNFNTVSVTGEYTLPSTDGSANQVIETNGAGVLRFITLPLIPTIYTPDVYEINSVTGISSTNTLLTFSGSGDPTIIDGNTGTTRSTGRNDSITFNSTGTFEISYSVQMQQGEASPGDGKRMNPQVYAKYGVSEETEVIAGSSDITYIRLIGSNQAPNGACTCTFYVDVTNKNHILELLVTFTQPATNIDLDIVQFESVPNALSIRKIT